MREGSTLIIAQRGAGWKLQVAQLIGCVVGRRRDAERGQVVGRLADEALLHELDHVIKPALERGALRRGVGLLPARAQHLLALRRVAGVGEAGGVARAVAEQLLPLVRQELPAAPAHLALRARRPPIGRERKEQQARQHDR